MRIPQNYPFTTCVPPSLRDFRALLADLPDGDESAAAAAQQREPILTKPAGSLGRLEHLAEWMARWQGQHPPHAAQIHCVVFAGNHGVAARGVSAYPPEVTAQMVENYAQGGAAINQICAASNVDLHVIPLHLDVPTHDFTTRQAMDDAMFVEALQAGYQVVLDLRAKGCDVLCLGEMGIGNTTASAAICYALFGGTPADWVGPGTGVSADGIARKQQVLATAIKANQLHISDGLDILQSFGGRELAAIAGAVLAARMVGVPVILDGFNCTAAAACLEGYLRHALDHCVVAHASAEPGHQRLCAELKQQPLLDLGLRLGEASGAGIAAHIVRMAVACHVGMSTFSDAGVETKSTS